MRGDPCRGNAEENAGEERQPEGKRDHCQSRGGVDGNALPSGEGERQQHACAQEGYSEAHKCAEAGEKNAFREELANYAAALRAERNSDGDFGATAHAADEQ